MLIDSLRHFDEISFSKLLKAENDLIDAEVRDSIIAFEEKRLLLKDLVLNKSISEVTLYKQRRLDSLLNKIKPFFSDNMDYGFFRDKVKRESLLQLIDDFITIISNSNIEYKVFGNQEFFKEQINNNRKIEKRYNQIQDTLNQIEKVSELINNYYASIKNTFDQYSESKRKIEDYNNYYQTTKLEIEDLRFGIKGFFNNVDGYVSSINETEQKVKKLIDDISKRAIDNLSENEDKYSSAIKVFLDKAAVVQENNSQIQNEINILLQGANASKLAHIYENKRKEVESKLWIWLLGILITTSTIIVISYYKLIDKPLSTELLLERFLIILPVLLLDIFFIFQYNLKNKIVEEYRFKSSTATSLFAFNELIKSYETDKSQEFITKSLENLFKSPMSDKDYQNPTISILSKSYSKIEDRVDKLIEKLPKVEK